MKNILEQKFKPIKYVPQEVSSQEYGSTATKIGKQIQNEEHTIEKLQEDQIDPTSKL